jgi:sec-independent protein translocase protein TatA
MHCLLLLEFIGTTELLVVLLVALVVFGPRKLPELGRSLGRALNQLQAASDDFKRTWETESRVDAGARARLPPTETSEEPALEERRETAPA